LYIKSRQRYSGQINSRELCDAANRSSVRAISSELASGRFSRCARAWHWIFAKIRGKREKEDNKRQSRDGSVAHRGTRSLAAPEKRIAPRHKWHTHARARALGAENNRSSGPSGRGRVIVRRTSKSRSSFLRFNQPASISLCERHCFNEHMREAMMSARRSE